MAQASPTARAQAGIACRLGTIDAVRHTTTYESFDATVSCERGDFLNLHIVVFLHKLE